MKRRVDGGRARRIRVAVLLIALLLGGATALNPSRVSANDAVITFDDLHNGDDVGNQYAAQGVTFVTSGGPISETPTLPVVMSNPGTTSPPNDASIRDRTCTGEFCQNLVLARFASPRSHVSVNVSDSRSNATAFLTAYNEVGPVGGTSGSASVHVDSTSFRPLSVSSPGNDIVYVEISGDGGAHLVIDDMTFDGGPQSGPPDGSTTTAAPVPQPGTPGGSSATLAPVPLPASCSIAHPVTIPLITGTSGSIDVALTVRRSSAWTGQLTLATTGLPSGVSVAFTAPSVSGPGTDDVRAVVRTDNAHSGDLALTITGLTDTGTVACTADVTLTVREQSAVVVKGFEVTSGVQTDHLPQRTGSEATVPYAGVLLPEGKKTVVRVFATATEGPTAGVPGVDATLSGYRPGSATPLPGSPLHPQWGEQTLPVDTAYFVDEQRRDPTQGFAFVLPPDWTTGALELEAHVSAATGPFSGIELCASAACSALQTLRLTGVAFTPMVDVHIVPVAMPDGPGLLPAPTYTCFTWKDLGGYVVPANPYTCPNSGVFADARQVSPVGDGQLHIPDYHTYIDIHDLIARTFNSSDGGKDGAMRGVEVNWRLWKYANAHEDALMNTEEFDPRVSNIIIGVVPAGKGIGTRAKGAECRDSSGLGECDWWRVASVPASGRPLGVAHELFHMYGRFHASPCMTKASGPVGNFDDWPPDQKGFLQGYGLDTREGSGIGAGGGPYRVLGVDVATGRATHTVDATPWYDFMSYCDDSNNDWVSVPNWNATISALAIGDPRTPTLSATVATPAADVVQPNATSALAVSAFADPTAGVFFGSVGPSGRYRTPPPDNSAPYRLVSRDQSGQQIGETPMTVRATHVEQGALGTELVAVIPGADVATLQIVREGRVLASRTRASRPPTVTLTAPHAGDHVDGHPMVVTWTTTAAPVHEQGMTAGDVGREASLDYSDDGRAWHTIYAGPDSGSAVLPAKLLPHSDHARLRLTVNDGFQDVLAISEPFTSAGADPSVQILSPANDARMVSNTNAYLSGSAADDSGHPLRTDQLIWYLNDRQVATGALASVSNLPAGAVVLKLIGHDDRGRLGGAQLCLWVSKTSVDRAASPSVCSPGALRDPRTGLLVGAVVGGDVAHSRVLPVAAAAVALALLLGGVAWVIARRRRQDASPATER